MQTQSQPEVDEYSHSVKKVQPNLLGDGIRLFDNLAGYGIDLEKIRVIAAPDVTHLCFRVIK